MSAALYDETQWSYEPADPGVGIFHDAWVHEGCAREYDQGCRAQHALEGRTVRNGMVYATEVVTVECLDCGVTTTVEDEVFVDFEGEQGV